MITEFENLRQIAGEDERRLFSDADFALYVWYRNKTISGFELCYDLKRYERAVLWTQDHGFSHYAVDEGEEPGRAGQTPVLSSVEAPLGTGLREAFEATSGGLEREIRELVMGKLKILSEESRPLPT